MTNNRLPESVQSRHRKKVTESVDTPHKKKIPGNRRSDGYKYPTSKNKSSDGYGYKSKQNSRTGAIAPLDERLMLEEKPKKESLRWELTKMGILIVMLIPAVIFSRTPTLKPVSLTYSPPPAVTMHTSFVLLSDDMQCSAGAVRNYHKYPSQSLTVLYQALLCLQVIGKVTTKKQISITGFVQDETEVRNYDTSDRDAHAPTGGSMSKVEYLDPIFKQMGNWAAQKGQNLKAELERFPARFENGSKVVMSKKMVNQLYTVMIPPSKVPDPPLHIEDELNWKYGNIEYITSGQRTFGPLAVTIIQAVLNIASEHPHTQKTPDALNEVILSVTKHTLSLYPNCSEWTMKATDPTIMEQVVNIIGRWEAGSVGEGILTYKLAMRLSSAVSSTVLVDYRTNRANIAIIVLGDHDSSDRLYEADSPGTGFVNAAPLVIKIHGEPVYAISASGKNGVFQDVVHTAVHCLVRKISVAEAMREPRPYIDLQNGSIKRKSAGTSTETIQAVEFTLRGDVTYLLSSIQHHSDTRNEPVGF